MGASVAGNIPDVSEAVWEGEVPFSPTLPGLSPGLALELGSGRRDGHVTAVAAIRYRMPNRVVKRYHGAIAPAIFMLAVDLGTGDVYEGACLGHDQPPATFDEPAARAATVAGAAYGGTVNVELSTRLGLPPRAARYLVFAWLDEWTSAVKQLDVPADPRRELSPLRAAANTADAVHALPVSSPPPASALSLAPAGTGKLHARWNLAEPTPVVLVGYNLERRRVHWELLGVGRKAGAVEIDTATFLGAAAVQPKAFVLIGGGHVAAALDGL